MKLTPKQMTPEQLNKVVEVTAQQTGKQSFKKTTDDSVMFQVPINDKVLVYVPNYFDVIDGVEQLRMDKPFLHKIKEGTRTSFVRCTAGLEELGYHSCPLCEATQAHWDLANIQVEEACKEKGLDKDNKESEPVREIRSKFYKNRVLDNAQRKYIFPIVIINNKEKDTDGFPVITPAWYSISERFYNEKWAPVLKNLESGNTIKDFDIVEEEVKEGEIIPSPGGKYFVLDYTYTSKDGKYDAMQSALHLKVFPQSYVHIPKFVEKMMEATKEMTPLRASQVIIDNMFYEEDDLRALADSITEPVLQCLELYENKIDSVPVIEANKDVKAIENKEEKPEAKKAPVNIETDEMDFFENDLEII